MSNPHDGSNPSGGTGTLAPPLLQSEPPSEGWEIDRQPPSDGELGLPPDTQEKYSPSGGNPIRLLYISSDPETLAAVKGILEPYGFDVRAEKPDGLLDKLSKERKAGQKQFDVVFIDNRNDEIATPNYSADIVIARALDRSRIPVLISTGSAKFPKNIEVEKEMVRRQIVGTNIKVTPVVVPSKELSKIDIIDQLANTLRRMGTGKGGGGGFPAFI